MKCLYGVLLSLFFAASIITVHADEALLEESSGFLAPVEGDSTDIRMVSERVIIELGRTSYTVDASFEFMNDGDTVTVPVGFPDFGYGYTNAFKGVRTNDTFKTWVNGEACTFKNTPGMMNIRIFGNPERDIILTDPDSLDTAHANLQKGLNPIETNSSSAMFVKELRWLVKEVTFPSGKTTSTRVRYTAVYGNFGHLEYLYGTGRTWKGTIGKAVFVVKSSPEVWMQSVPQFARGGFTSTRSYIKQRAGEFEHEYILTDVEPFESEIFSVFVKKRNLKQSEQPWEFYSEFEYDDKPVDDSFLDILSLDQLRLFRNSFYAIHGKVFHSSDLDTYFRNTYWYKPREDFEDTDLTKIEQENIRKIIAKEQWLKELISSY
ncbi:MAG: YARHG domain-containing protein [Candidatus Latescibacteria bacterium]|nr:YARHG domain-containing protein [Candidatus Latescibacterota bacterium]